MYTGIYFRKSLKYALSISDPKKVFILSSKYGFIPLNRIIEPYDVRFGQNGALSQAEVNESAQIQGLADQQALFIGSKDYYLRAKAAIRRSEWLTLAISGGKGIICQYHWLNSNAGFNPFAENAAA